MWFITYKVKIRNTWSTNLTSKTPTTKLNSPIGFNSFSFNLYGFRWRSSICSYPRQSVLFYFLAKSVKLNGLPLFSSSPLLLIDLDGCHVTHIMRGYSNILYFLPARKKIIYIFFWFLVSLLCDWLRQRNLCVSPIFKFIK